MKLEIKDLTFEYDTTPVLEHINLQVETGFNVIIGPNAAGKSTLLKCIFGLLDFKGKIMFGDKKMSFFKKEELSRLIGYLPQEVPNPSALTVFETVLLGRLHNLSWRVSEQDLSIVLKILEDLGIDNLALRPFNKLSGGQKQMVLVAQLLVRNPKIILMDEPTNNLDLQNQLEIIDLMCSITWNRQIISIIALHDLNLTARYAENVIVLDGKGGIYASGEPVSVITSEMISLVYGVDAKVTIDEEGIPVISAISSIKKVTLGEEFNNQIMAKNL